MPDGVTCCQRMSPLILSVQVGVERLDAGVPAARAEAGAWFAPRRLPVGDRQDEQGYDVRADRAAMDDSVGTSVDGVETSPSARQVPCQTGATFPPGTSGGAPPARA